MCVEAHGHFRTGHCLNDECKTRYTQDWMKGITNPLSTIFQLYRGGQFY
jgi:hypothetical protein